MSTFDTDAVSAAIADSHHLNLHARASISNIDGAVTLALGEVADLLRGAGASEEEIGKATTAFQPVVRLIREARSILESRQCECADAAEKLLIEASALRQRAAEAMGETHDGRVVWAAKRFRHVPPHRDLIGKPGDG